VPDLGDERPFEDELARLRESWRGAEPRTGRGGELADEDAATRATVELLRRAFAGLEPALAAPPPRRRPPLRLLPRALALAAALALLAVGLRLRAIGEDPEPDAEPGLEVVQNTPETPPVPPVKTPRFSPADAAPDLEVEVTSDQRLILCAGTVRLYLPGPRTLASAAVPPFAHTPETETQSK
jgi:hypothetical protein